MGESAERHLIGVCMTDTTQTFNPATTAVGPQTPIALNHLAQSEASIAVYDEAGDAEYGVEFTLDDVNNVDTPRWFMLTDIPAGSSGSRFTSITLPCKFVRLNLTFITGAVEFKVLQTVESY